MTLQDLTVNIAFWSAGAIGTAVANRQLETGLLPSLGIGAISAFSTAGILLLLIALRDKVRSKPPGVSDGK